VTVSRGADVISAHVDVEHDWTFGLVPGLQKIPGMSMKTDALKDRVEARKHELLAKFNDLKADTRTDASDAKAKVKHKLDELELHLKEGWDKLSEQTRSKLDQWLKN
jgi:hypothetical protein